MARFDDDTPWMQQLLLSAAVLVAVAVVIGAVVGLVTLGAVRVAGLGESTGGSSAAPSLVMPTGRPTTGLDGGRGPAGQPSPGTTASATTPPTKPAKPRAITLTAGARQVGPGGRIDLSGRYRGGNGARLQVQRFDQGWVDFPVQVSVTGGRFATYVTTGRTGLNRFRVVDPDAERTSNAVRVRVG